MGDPSDIPQDFVAAFEVAAGRLRKALAGACEAERPWPARVGAAILAVLDFAAAEPAAARVLALDSLAQGPIAALLRQHLVDEFAELLAAGREERSVDAVLWSLVDQAQAGSLAGVVGECLRAGEEGNVLPRLGPELVELTLLPYVGSAEAKRWAESSTRPPQ